MGRRMTACVVALVLAFAAGQSAFAQIFPGVNGADTGRAVKKAEDDAKGGEVSKPAEDPKKADKPEEVKKPDAPAEPVLTEKEQKELEKAFDEAIKGIKTEQKKVETLSRQLSAAAHPEEQGVVDGLMSLYSEQFKDATKLATITPAINIVDKNPGQTRITAHNHLRGGEGLLRGFMARALKDFDLDFKDEKAVKAKAKTVAKAAKTDSDMMVKMMGDQSGTWIRTGLQDRSKKLADFGEGIDAAWTTAWNAWTTAKDKRYSVDAVWAFVKAVNNDEGLVLNLHVRALCTYLMARFPKSSLVVEGEPGVALAWSYARTFQWDDAAKALGEASTLSNGNKKAQDALGEAKDKIDEFRREAELGLLNVKRGG
jgi:hypothetical protein